MVMNKISDSISSLGKLQKDLSYHFINEELLIEALSHPSLKQLISKSEIQRSYERLELLGDSIINFVVTEILFTIHSTYSEGKLAKIRAYLVSKELLCQVAARLNLSDYIIMTNGEETLGGRKNLNNIENTMEALIAAVYLDSNIDITKKILHNLWQEFLVITNGATYDPKSTLQELVQKNGTDKPVYKIIKREGSAHLPIFRVSVGVNLKDTKNIMQNYQQIATGYTVKEAEKKAARKLINFFQSLN